MAAFHATVVFAVLAEAVAASVPVGVELARPDGLLVTRMSKLPPSASTNTAAIAPAAAISRRRRLRGKGSWRLEEDR
jgi:hypothetical protein